jgi:hypothetical protein
VHDHSPLAGKPAPKEMLVDLARLEGEYIERRPDLDNPEQRVSFGTSGHRGSSLRGSFTEAHILAITQAICDFRRMQGTDGPLFMGRDTHRKNMPGSIDPVTGHTHDSHWQPLLRCGQSLPNARPAGNARNCAPTSSIKTFVKLPSGIHLIQRHVRFGSKADMTPTLCNVRFNPESGHSSADQRCPLCTNSGHRQKALQ